MAYGVKTLRALQIGTETTAGTAVAATTVWGGPAASIKDAREIVLVEQDDANLQADERSYVPNHGATYPMPETEATFEQLPYILAAGVESVVSGSQDGTLGTGYIYQYDMSSTAVQTPKTFTLECGDNTRVDEMEYSFVESFTLSGAANEAVMMSANWRGRQSLDSEFTTAQTVPTNLEEILFNKGTIAIDATGGTIGNTTKTATWRGFTLDVDTGHQPVETGDGNLYFSAIKQVSAGATGTLIFEHDATGEAELNAARGESIRLVRMLFSGSALTTAGDAYTYKTLKVDMAIKYTDVPELGEADGDDLVELPFQVVYSSADSLGAQFIVVQNSVTTLP